MSVDALEVFIAERPAGTLRRRRSGQLEFTYHDEYLGDPQPTPLSSCMPVHGRAYGGAALTAWLWGLLPDNNAVLERWARRFQVSLASPFGLLASPVGADCAGAVRFLAVGGDVGLDDVRWLDGDEIAARIRELRGDSTAWLGSNFSGRFSLAGAQAKTALHHDGQRWGEARGTVPTTHILKPAVTGLDDHDLNEHLCLAAARMVGLSVVNSSVRTFGDQRCVVVERYDRRRTQQGWERIHQEDLCQALGVHPANKYQAEGGPGPGDLVRLLQRVIAGDARERAVRAFVDALLFNWIIAGTDAHAKNYSLLLAGDQVRLAPLYDLASALPYGQHVRRLRLAMKLGSDYRLHPGSAGRWSASARQLDLDVDELRGRAANLLDAVPQAFETAVAELDDDLVALTEVPRRLVTEVGRRVEFCRSELR